MGNFDDNHMAFGGSGGLLGALNVADIDDSTVRPLAAPTLFSDASSIIDDKDPEYGKASIIVIPIETIDRPRHPKATQSFIEQRMFGRCGLEGYFKAFSAGQYSLAKHVVAPWVTINKNITDYSNAESGPQFKIDALELADVNWDLIDQNGDGVIDPDEAVFVFLVQGLWASNRSHNLGKIKTKGGKVYDFGSHTIINYGLGANTATEPFEIIAPLAHELGHRLFNLPDRYVNQPGGGQHAGFVGVYDIMGASSKIKWTGLNAHDRMKIGWLEPRILVPESVGRMYRFRPAASSTDAVVLWPKSINSTAVDEYWILEYRTNEFLSRVPVICPAVTFDNALPNNGLAVWWVNHRPSILKNASGGWKNGDDLRLVDAGASTPRDPDGSGLSLNTSNDPVPSSWSNPGYFDQSGKSLFEFRQDFAVTELLRKDGTKSPFRFYIYQQKPLYIDVFIEANGS